MIGERFGKYLVDTRCAALATCLRSRSGSSCRGAIFYETDSGCPVLTSRMVLCNCYGMCPVLTSRVWYQGLLRAEAQPSLPVPQQHRRTVRGLRGNDERVWMIFAGRGWISDGDGDGDRVGGGAGVLWMAEIGDVEGGRRRFVPVRRGLFPFVSDTLKSISGIGLLFLAAL
eukprot:1714196-Rhodomonas_salina.2